MTITDRRSGSVSAAATTDRLGGIPEGLCCKAPVRVASTANITLNGLQAIDGITVAAGERVLVKNQTVAADNGIYDAATGNWTRSVDAATNGDIVRGTRVYVTSGTLNAFREFAVTSADRIVIGTDAMAWSALTALGIGAYAVGDLLYASSTTQLASLPDVALGSVLVSQGVGVAPAYSSSPLLGSAINGVQLNGGVMTSGYLLDVHAGVGTSLAPSTGGSIAQSKSFINTGGSGAGKVFYGFNSEVHINLGTGGSSVGGQFYAVNEGTWTYSGADFEGAVGIFGYGRSDRGGWVWGGNVQSVTTTIAAASNVGFEVDVLNSVNGTASKVGLQVVSVATDTGTIATPSLSYGYALLLQPGGSGFHSGFYFGSGVAKNRLIYAAGGSLTTGIDISALTISGNAWASPSATIDGTGSANFGNVTGRNGIFAGVQNTTAGAIAIFGGTSGSASIVVQGAAGAATITLGTSSGTPAVTASSPLAITTASGNITCATCVTSSGGGAITGTAPIAVSAAGAVSITGAAGQVLAGATPAFTATPTLGASGTLGSITFGNATSGLLTLQSATGALGTVTLSLPAATDTIAVLAASQAFTNKTYNGNTWTAGTGTLTIAAAKTLTDTSGVGAVLLLGATGGGFTAYAGGTCTSQFVSAISAAGAITCSSVTDAEVPLTNTHILVGNSSNVAVDVALSGDATLANTGALTLASVITAGGPTGSATVAPIITYDAKGRLTTVSSATITPAASSITNGAALSKADDTNVTLTLGGSPTTALLAATSLTLGWTGTLAPARGGTGIANNAASTLTISGNFATTLTVSGTTGVTLPTSGTLATLAGSEELTNKTLNASVGKGTWTASGTWTLPAYTLNGTVSGGGNQINNVIIGTSTPLAGFFTAITGTSIATNGTDTVTSASASALTVGRLGATTPAFQVDASTATSITGIKIKSAASGGGVAVSAIGETNVGLTIDAAGSGTITLGATSTGAITLTRATTLSAALTYGGVTLSNAVTGTGNMVLSASPTITGTLGADNVNSGVGYQIVGVNAFAKSGNYHIVYDPDGATVLLIGNTVDPTVYFDKTTTKFRAIGGGTTFLTLNATGLAVGVATDATSTSTGAIQNPGGMSVNKRVWMNGISAAAGTVSAACQINTGEIAVNTGVVSCLLSARDLKNNIRQLPDMRPILLAMKPRLFDWNDAAMPKDQPGFIADEVPNIFAALDAKGRPFTWRPETVTAALVNGYQGHDAAIQTLKADNDNLRAEIEQLKRKIAA